MTEDAYDMSESMLKGYNQREIADTLKISIECVKDFFRRRSCSLTIL